jgi:hypothetical protein
MECSTDWGRELHIYVAVKDNVRMYLRVIEWGGMDWVNLDIGGLL